MIELKCPYCGSTKYDKGAESTTLVFNGPNHTYYDCSCTKCKHVFHVDELSDRKTISYTLVDEKEEKKLTIADVMELLEKLEDKYDKLNSEILTLKQPHYDFDKITPVPHQDFYYNYSITGDGSSKSVPYNITLC